MTFKQQGKNRQIIDCHSFQQQLKQIKRKFWGSSDDVLGNDMIEIGEAYGIVCECIGYEEE